MIRNNRKFNFQNCISIIILMIFLLAELMYLNVIPNHDLNNIVDNLPKRFLSLLESKKKESPVIITDETIATESTINETLETKNRFDSHYEITTVTESYFENTLFIGDSRMLGFSIYRKLPGATYYCYQSASAFTILEKEHEVEEFGKITLSDLLYLKRFDKIYISLGINNVAAGLENHRNHYKNMLDFVIRTQPDAIIYLLGNLHVTAELKSDMIYLNNENINNINLFISQFEDKRQIFYFDPNEIYDDEFGNMNSELSYDKAHIYLRHYDRLLYFLLTHAVVYDE